MKGKPVPILTRIELKRALEAGKRPSVVARSFGLSTSIIGKIAVEYGIPPRHAAAVRSKRDEPEEREARQTKFRADLLRRHRLLDAVYPPRAAPFPRHSTQG